MDKYQKLAGEWWEEYGRFRAYDNLKTPFENFEEIIKTFAQWLDSQEIRFCKKCGEEFTKSGPWLICVSCWYKIPFKPKI